MSKIKLPFFILAIVAVACMSGIGVAISYRSTLGAILSFLAFVAVMGYGFILKRKLL